MLEKTLIPFTATMEAVSNTLKKVYWKWYADHNMRLPAFMFVSTTLAQKWPYAVVKFAIATTTAVVFYRPAMAEKPSFYFGDVYEQENIG